MIKTAETYHVSVLLKESVDGLAVQPGGIYVDVTFGGGGHSREILGRLGKNGRLFGFDQDADAESNIMNDNRFTFVRSNFRYLKNWMRFHNVEQIDGLLADLGVSSHHFDDETRGFSFRFDAPLDMRMNKRAGMTAADVLNNYTEEQLADIFYLYGELKNARKLASVLVKARQESSIETTGQLLQLTEKIFAREREKKEVTKLFQALRIEVNHEMDALREMLNGACQMLRPGGRLSVITYHSLEDRIVKNVMRTGNAEGKVEQDFFGRTKSPLHLINNRVIVPTDDELERNPRSRSAKLRIAELEGKTIEMDGDLMDEQVQKVSEDELPATLKRMKESASEGDEAPVGSLSLKQIVGGDYLFSLVRHHIWLIMLIVLITIVYVGVRYQCEQDVLEIDQLEKDLVNAKYKAMSSSSNLTELCRQSNVLKVLHENEDTLLQFSDQPPYIIDVPEE